MNDNLSLTTQTVNPWSSRVEFHTVGVEVEERAAESK